MDYYRGLEDIYQVGPELLQAQLVELESALKNAEIIRDPDTLVGLQLMQADLQARLKMELDRRLASSISAAVESDGECVQRLLALEALAEADRRAALNFAMNADDQMPPANPCHKSHTPDSDDENVLEWLSTWNVRGDGGGLRSAASSSRPEGNCSICLERKLLTNLTKVPCKHKFCGNCLSRHFAAATIDESLYPPKCCGVSIPLTMAQPFMSANLSKVYADKMEEWETRNRVYCANANCCRFISPKSIEGDVATCEVCKSVTCIMCQGKAHRGDCPQDHALKALLKTAEECKWRRCYNCNRVVELASGCNHMTCPCGAHFCYICGTHWKKCLCPLWDERKLIKVVPS